MRKLIVMMASLAISAVTMAGNIFVYAVNGTAEKKVAGKWVALAKRAELSENDIVRVNKGASLSIIDRGAEKIYATGEVAEKSVSAIIKEQASGSASGQFVSHAVKSLFNGGTDNISHQAAGCTYRGDVVESDIAKAILSKKSEEDLRLNVDNAKSDFGIAFDLVDRTTGEVVNSATVGREVYFRVKNNSAKMLYVNVLDVASDGQFAECLPVDDAQTLSHLLIPSNCVIDLYDYPIALTEPVGTDNLILVASEVPYDLRQVTRYLSMKNLKADSKQQIGVYGKTIAIMK